jgi:3-phosphoshikimate 1-carboxyvinyltransferase
MSDGRADEVRAVHPLSAPPDRSVRLPGSKSLTNRALVCAALAAGPSELEGVLVADDSDAMVECLGRLGVGIELDRTAVRAIVNGVGGVLPAGEIELDARLSGTTSRFVLPVLALGPGRYRLDGLPPLRRRPMGPLVDALRQLDAEVTEEGEPGCLPLVVSGGRALAGRVNVQADVSSQFVSALMLSGPCFPAGLRLDLDGPTVSEPYVAMTARVMEAFGARPDQIGVGYQLPGGGYRPTSYAVEPDASTASYFFAAAVIGGGRVRVEGLARGSLQGDLGFVDVLARMGADVEWGSDSTAVRAGETLRGIDVDLSDTPDVAPTLAAVAVFANGPTTVRNVALIREHETDRIAAVVTELRRCGIEAHEHPDGFTVVPGAPRPAVIQTYDDHRMAMSFALLGLRADGIEIADPGCVAKTFPEFFDCLDGLRGPNR